MGQCYTQCIHCASDHVETYRLRQTSASTPPLTFNRQRKLCKVVDVYDGDTIKVVFLVHRRPYLWKVRLAGIDTPELRTSCEQENAHGYMVRDALRERILDHVIVLQCGGFDKYGRLLGTPYHRGVNLCDWMVQRKFAVPYDGGTKKPWKDILANRQSHATQG